MFDGPLPGLESLGWARVARRARLTPPHAVGWRGRAHRPATIQELGCEASDGSLVSADAVGSGMGANAGIIALAKRTVSVRCSGDVSRSRAPPAAMIQQISKASAHPASAMATR